jgi:hypothetical protein
LSAECKVEIEINDAPNRIMLSRKPLQEKIMADFSVSVTTRGRWFRPGEKKPSMADTDKPLHLFIEGEDPENVQKAVAKVREILTQTPVAQPSNQGGGRGAGGGRPRVLSERLFLQMNPIPGFDMADKLCGEGDSFLEYIESQSSASVSYRGRGASAGPPSRRRQDSSENLHLYIEHPSRNELIAACQLAEKLIDQVRAEYDLAAAAHWGQAGTYGNNGGYPPQNNGYTQPYQQQQQYQYPPPSSYPPQQGYSQQPPAAQYSQPAQGYYPPPSQSQPQPTGGSAPLIPPPAIVGNTALPFPLPAAGNPLMGYGTPGTAYRPAPAPAPTPPQATSTFSAGPPPPSLPPPPARRSFTEKVNLAPPPTALPAYAAENTANMASNVRPAEDVAGNASKRVKGGDGGAGGLVDYAEDDDS